MWEAYLYHVTSGVVGPKIRYESVSWSIELNSIESISLQLMKSDLPTVDLNLWLSPWWAGVALFWNGKPIVAGPITTRPNETKDKVSINCGGIRSILAKRIIVKEPLVGGWNDNKSAIKFKGFSLGTIAKFVTQTAQQKPGGTLPINFPLPDETAAMGADHERTYEGFNVQNLTCDEVLTKLSNVIDGPDIMFKPRLTQDNRLVHDMYYGTEDQPRIAQTITPVWDMYPVQGQASEISVIYTGSYQASRVYSIGAGQDQGLLITVDTDENPLQNGYPLLEKVINVGSSENPDIVRGHGLAELESNAEGLLEIQMTVRGDGPIGFGTFWPGDLSHVYVKGLISLPDGLTKMRILSMTGDGTANVKLSLQKEDKFV